ncbi:type II toxin-antitoxin system HipA family toxin [Burkholderia plantarii]|uniref:type II toxin-antitoxin system HipA family toxin n=1 Tax=Burkholderia plantarii TaxID=41899 RepID=UPI0018DB377B|nr:type II toxin-antitoxin system HipA family toxin [Burkholderia plantarii]MBI0330819.1 type II toxin-antitoxin system HipA family toxin [Burkholderia plantarii]
MKELRVIYRGGSEPFDLAILADDGRNVLFEYTPQALARRLELSPINLRLRPQAYPDRQYQYESMQRVPGLLHDALPDAWGYRVMASRMRAHHVDFATTSTLERLAFLGERTMGALTFEPASGDPANIQGASLSELIDDYRALITDESHILLPEIARAGASPGGARPKAMVWYRESDRQMTTGENALAGAEPWLVKFPADGDAEDSCALEAAYAEMARAAGLGFMPFQFFDLGSLGAFATKRFDLTASQRLHVHTLAGLLHADFRVPSVGYGMFFRATRQLSRDVREVENAVRICIFNILMNNRDDHAKNVSFMMDAQGQWKLAPPYDLTYCPGYQGEHFMDVAGEGGNPGRDHVVHAAGEGGIAPARAEQLVDEILQKADSQAWRRAVSNYPVRPGTARDVGVRIEANRRMLQKRKA